MDPSRLRARSRKLRVERAPTGRETLLTLDSVRTELAAKLAGSRDAAAAVGEFAELGALLIAFLTSGAT